MGIERNEAGNPLFPTGLYQSYEDTSFTAAETLRVIDAYTDLNNKKVNNGYIVVDGSGDLLVELATGKNIAGTYKYGDQFTLKSGDVYDLQGDDIYAIRLTHSGTDTAYRIKLA